MKTAFSENDDISSTEKLLDVIRGEGISSTGSPKISVLPSPLRSQRAQRFFKYFPYLQKRITVGVEIGHGYLILVKTAQLSESRCKLLDYRLIPFKHNLPRRTPEFYELLRTAVIEFCGSLTGVNLWGSLSTAQVDLRQIRIPKVAKEELFNAIFWTAKREMNFDEKECVFDFEIQGEVVEDGVAKIRVMAYTAPKDAVKEIRDLFSKSGLNLAGLTISAFAVQNLFRTQWVPTPNISSYANLYMSESHSRITIFSEGNVILIREIKTGVDSLIISLVESFSDAKEERPVGTTEAHEVPASLDVLEEKLDVLDIKWERARNILFCLGDHDRPVSQEGVTGPLDEKEILELVSPALERLIRQVERTFEFYAKTGKTESVQRIFISGAVHICGAVLDHISQSLGIRIEIVDPLNPANPFLTNVTPPLSIFDRACYTSTLGLALSDNSRTPNLLFTFNEKEQQAAVARINRSITLVFMSVFFLLMVFFLWQKYNSHQKNAEIFQLQQELAQLTTPIVDQNQVVQLAAKVKSQEHIRKGQVDEYLGIAVLSELSALTPANVRLISITADLGGIQEVPLKDAGPGQNKGVSKSLVLDGVVQGDSQAFEASLALYLMRLGSSPIFISPTVHSSSIESYQEIGEVLHFVLKMGLV